MSLKVELLEQSFEGIKPHADAFVNSFYENLFTAYPEAKPLFANTHMAEQKTKLLGSLVLVVENLRTPEVLNDTLKGLGARHVKYGALPEHYPLVGNALLTTFEQYLGEQWTPEVKQAWIDAYSVISEIMLDGADYSDSEIALDASIQTKEDKTIPGKEADYSELPLDIELLESSFCQIRPQLAEFSASFYNNLFTTYPETKLLFANTDMKAQERKLVDSLILVVLNLRKPGFLTEALAGLGTRHIDYGALPEHYPLVGNALLTTFENYLGSDWTPKLKQAWTDAYNLISKIMLEGAEYSESDIILERIEIPKKSAKAPLLELENEDSRTETDTGLNRSEKADANGSYWGFLGGILAGGGLILLLLLLL